MSSARVFLFAVSALALTSCSTPATNNASEADSGGAEVDSGADAREPVELRIATYNASMYRSSLGELAGDLAGGEDAHAKRVAEVLQRVRPDIVLVNEFDYDPDGGPDAIFASEYLGVSQSGLDPIEYPYRYAPASNTGESSGVDLNKDGNVGSEQGTQQWGDDSFGFGRYPGQYAMVVYSRYPIDTQGVRTFRTLLWKDMPGNQQPTDWYTPEAVEVMRLSSKTHADVPVDVDGRTLHVLASHPTPPSFDGDEDRNGRRNHDEIRLWVDYVTGGEGASYLVDDAGETGGLGDGEAFFVAGDLNSDPADGDSRREALADLLAHPRVQDTLPASEGGEAAAESDGGANRSHTGDPSLDTADFSDGRVGNLRVDYVLPSTEMTVRDSGVFWPADGAEGAQAASVSDHHLVWVDVTL